MEHSNLYSKETAALMDKWEEIILKAPYVWNEIGIMAGLRKFYEALEVKFPENPKIKKCKDIFDKDFQFSAYSASASSASASLAYLASSASASLAYLASSASASLAYLASSASASLAYLASSASASLAYLASSASASLAYSAYSALAYLAYRHIFSFEFYLKNPDKKDKKGEQFLKSQEAIMEAYKNGLGYFAEKEGIFYLVPAPIVRLNEQKEKHSELFPAIEWKEGVKKYFLKNVEFSEELWKKIVSKSLSGKEAFSLKNTEQRIIAISYLGGEKIIKELGGEVFAKDKWGELVRLTNLKDSLNEPYVFLKAFDPVENSDVYLRVPPDMKTPKEAEEWIYFLNEEKIEYEPSIRT